MLDELVRVRRLTESGAWLDDELPREQIEEFTPRLRRLWALQGEYTWYWVMTCLRGGTYPVPEKAIGVFEACELLDARHGRRFTISPAAVRVTLCSIRGSRGEGWQLTPLL